MTAFIRRENLPTYYTTSTNNDDNTIYPQTIIHVYTGEAMYFLFFYPPADGEK